MSKRDRMCDRMWDRRRELGLTQFQAAKRSGCSKGTYCNYEQGRTIPSVYIFNRIAKTLETTMDYLMNGDNDDV